MLYIAWSVSYIQIYSTVEFESIMHGDAKRMNSSVCGGQFMKAEACDNEKEIYEQLENIFEKSEPNFINYLISTYLDKSEVAQS